MALFLLDISPERLQNMTHPEQRNRYIRYKHLYSELIYSHICRINQWDESFLLTQLNDLAQRVYKYSQYFRNDEYSHYSVALQDLESRGIDKPSQRIGLRDLESKSSDSPTRPRRSSFVVTGNKEKGVEPGFKVALVEDLLFSLEEFFPTPKERLDYFHHHKGDFNILYNLQQNNLSNYLIKMDYLMKSNRRVIPPTENLKRSSEIQNAYELHRIWGKICLFFYKQYKSGKPQEKNGQAVLEALNNDLTRAAGMVVQEQTLCKSTYENGILKLLLKGRWLKEASSLSLAGGLEGSHYNYLVRSVPSQSDGIQFLSDDSITDLAEHYATFIIHGDCDAIGKKGNNKLVFKNKLFGIDFAHAYCQKSELISLLLPSLRLPASQIKKYANFSIFYDSKRSELMKGALIYAKLRGRTLSDQVLAEYDEVFREKLEQIETNSLDKVFDDYILKFQKLSTIEPTYKEDYLAFIELIEKRQAMVRASSNYFLDKMQDNIELPPVVHYILENLEKISMGASETSLRSPDGTVLLKHLRFIHEEQIIHWTALKMGEVYRFSASFRNESQAREAQNRLLEFTGNAVNFNLQSNYLNFVYLADELPGLAFIIDEEEIKRKYHEKDYQLYQWLKKEIVKDSPGCVKESSPINRKGEEIEMEILSNINNEEKQEESLENVIKRSIREENLDELRAFFLSIQLDVDKVIDKETGNTALHIAVIENKPTMVEILVKKMDADSLIKNEKGKTALDLSILHPDVTFFHYIKESLDERSYINKRHPIYFALYDVLSKFEKPPKGLQSPKEMLNLYGDKLLKDKETHHFLRKVLGIEKNLLLQFSDYSSCYYTLKEAQLNFDPYLHKLCDLSTVKDKKLAMAVKNFSEFFFNTFDESTFKRRLIETKEEFQQYDERLNANQYEQKIKEIQEKFSQKTDEMMVKFQEILEEQKQENNKRLAELNAKIENYQKSAPSGEESGHNSSQNFFK